MQEDLRRSVALVIREIRVHCRLRNQTDQSVIGQILADVSREENMCLMILKASSTEPIKYGNEVNPEIKMAG